MYGSGFAVSSSMNEFGQIYSENMVPLLWKLSADAATFEFGCPYRVGLSGIIEVDLFEANK
jgi:hypothetical protein